VGKIPSYGLTWVLFQQIKALQLTLMRRPPTNLENTWMGCVGSAMSVSIMIPMDTIKTRLVTQNAAGQYKGILDCARQVLAKEGPGAFYKGLPPRLLSVVPMIGIQFGCYEFMKKLTLRCNADLAGGPKGGGGGDSRGSLEQITREVTADDGNPTATK
jgi:hypothetical protein